MLKGTLHIAPTLLGPVLTSSSLLPSLLCCTWSLCYPVSLPSMVWDLYFPSPPLDVMTRGLPQHFTTQYPLTAALPACWGCMVLPPHPHPVSPSKPHSQV